MVRRFWKLYVVILAPVSRTEHLQREVFVPALETLKKMEQILSNTMEVCSFITVSLGIVQNSYLTVSIILCTKTIYNYITRQKTCWFFDVNFLMRKWISFPTCAEIHVNSKHKILWKVMFCSFFFEGSTTVYHISASFSCPNTSCREAAAFFSISEHRHYTKTAAFFFQKTD